MVERSSGWQQLRGAALGLTAAALFGVSAPLAKILLGSISPVLLAGLLYGGAAFGLWTHRLCVGRSAEAALERKDVPTLGAVVLTGGILGPVLMLFGLERVSALSGSLLLNLEAPFTILLAITLFREHLGRAALVAAALVLVGGALIELQSGPWRAGISGGLLLAAACLCWAIDNNLTQRLSLRDPFAIVRVKTLVAGTCNAALGLFVLGNELPPVGAMIGALALGAASYGASVVLDAYALRLVGAAREAAYFATAPLFGVIVAIAVLDDRLRALDLVAMACMAAGAVLLVRERHAHVHTHEPIEHEHLHRHDEHHAHEHGPDDPPGEPHSHAHRHAPIEHEHPHVSDAHHRHEH